jgi:hypothetical protein
MECVQIFGCVQNGRGTRDGGEGEATVWALGEAAAWQSWYPRRHLHWQFSSEKGPQSRTERGASRIIGPKLEWLIY